MIKAPIELSLAAKPNERLFFTVDDNFPNQFTIAGDLHGTLEWNESQKQFAYNSDKDFSGTVDLTISYSVKSEPRSAHVIINVANTFRPRARIIRIIGQELISNDVIALVELIKNSYDADSTNVDITLNNILSSDGEILIRDNGSGMTFEKLVNVWLEPATPDKKFQNLPSFSECYQRRYLGEKGIGRFAVHRLGDRIELVTRARVGCTDELSNYETTVIIDWSDFTEEKYLEDVPIKINKNPNPSTFIESSGTLIKITQVNPWKSFKVVKEAVMKVKGMESPVRPKNIQLHRDGFTNDPGFSINIKSEDSSLNRQISEIKSLSELLGTAFYSFSALIDSKGEAVFQYKFDRPDYQDFKRPKAGQASELRTEDLKKYEIDWFEENPLTDENSPGYFEVSFYAWDLDSVSLKVAGLAEYYNSIIKPNAGVRIYRDNFRVWPYGEPDDDWLSLDLARLNAPRERSVSRNQVFGIVHISSIENPKLKDQSNREGLIDNPQYEHFYRLVNAAISLFATERKKDKIEIENKSKDKKLEDSVTERITHLRKKVEVQGHLNLYKNEIESLEASYKEKINDVLERYIMAAAIGISYSLPIHEMKLRLTSIKHIVEDLESNPGMQDKFLRQLVAYVNETDDILRAVTSMMSRQKRQKVSLFKVANNARVLKETDLKKYSINLEITGDRNLEVDAVPGLLNTAVLNIVDNSVYWLRAKRNLAADKNSKFSPTIKIDIGYSNDQSPTLKIRDNGLGFQDPIELLVEPYYSRKTDGLGLGLYLVKEIMTRIQGRIEGYNEDGAVVELIFKR